MIGSGGQAERPGLDSGFTVQAVYERLRREILHGEIPPGQQLSQMQLAQRLGVSRAPLREALRRLENEGLVEAPPNRSMRVASFSAQDLDEIYAMRLTLEAMTLRISLPRLTSADLGALEGLIAQMQHFAATGEYELWEAPHRAFHQGLTRHAGRRAQHLLEQLSDHAERYRRLYTMGTPNSFARGDRDHRMVLDAVKARDADAAAVRLVQHLARTPMTVFPLIDDGFVPENIQAVLAELTDRDNLPD